MAQPVDPLQCRRLEKQCRAKRYGCDDAQDDNHTGEGLTQRGTYLRELVERAKPLERAEDEGNLHQSGNPWSTDDEQTDQHQRSKNTD